MGDVINLHGMTLTDAKAWLARINYDEDWTIEQMIAATSGMTADDRRSLVTAFRVTAAALQQEATSLKRECDSAADLPLTTRRPAGAAAPLSDRDKAQDLRNKITGYFMKLSPARKKAWAEAHGVTRDDLRQYIVGDPYHLPAPKIAELIASIRNERKMARAKRART